MVCSTIPSSRHGPHRLGKRRCPPSTTRVPDHPQPEAAFAGEVDGARRQYRYSPSLCRTMARRQARPRSSRRPPSRNPAPFGHADLLFPEVTTRPARRCSSRRGAGPTGHRMYPQASATRPSPRSRRCGGRDRRADRRVEGHARCSGRARQGHGGAGQGRAAPRRPLPGHARTASPPDQTLPLHSRASIPMRPTNASCAASSMTKAQGLPPRGIARGRAGATSPTDWACRTAASPGPTSRWSRSGRAVTATPANDARPIVIVGSGLAGYTVARRLRKLDKRGAARRPQPRSRGLLKPMLSNALAGGRAATTLVMKPRRDGRGTAGDGAHASVTGHRHRRRTLALGGGETPTRDLVLALGADPIRLPLDGDGARTSAVGQRPGRLRAFPGACPACTGVAILGARLIGCRFANDLRRAHHTDRDRPAPGPAIAVCFRPSQRHLQPAPRVRRACSSASAPAARRVDRDASGAAAFRLTLDDGTRCADLVLSAIGLRPRPRRSRTAPGWRSTRRRRPAARRVGAIVPRWATAPRSRPHAAPSSYRSCSRRGRWPRRWPERRPRRLSRHAGHRQDAGLPDRRLPAGPWRERRMVS